MKLRIVNTGGLTTKVLNAVSGEELDDVTSVEWTHTGGGITRAIIHVDGVTADLAVSGDAPKRVNPPLPGDIGGLAKKGL